MNCYEGKGFYIDFSSLHFGQTAVTRLIVLHLAHARCDAMAVVRLGVPEVVEALGSRCLRGNIAKAGSDI